MIKIIHMCDICGNEIPIEKKKDLFGIEREYLQIGKFNYMGDKPFTIPNLLVCKSCANKIDVEMLKFKVDILSKHPPKERKRYRQNASKRNL